MTLAKLVILNPSNPVILSPSHPVILSNAKDLGLLRVNSAKSLRTSSVKNLWQNDPPPDPWLPLALRDGAKGPRLLSANGISVGSSRDYS